MFIEFRRFPKWYHPQVHAPLSVVDNDGWRKTTEETGDQAGGSRMLREYKSNAIISGNLINSTGVWVL